MLKYRLIFGPLMIAVLLGVLYLDNRLDRVALPPALRRLFLDRPYLPAGLSPWRRASSARSSAPRGSPPAA
jgi:phosphatidate cytidylyltransferase